MSTLRKEAIFMVVLCLGILALPAIHWYRQHARDERETEDNQAKIASDHSELDAALGRLKSKWSANDDWQNDLPTQSRFAPYSIDLEHALVKRYPLIFYGSVEDVRNMEGEQNPAVSVRVHTQKSSLRLRLLLDASPELTSEITNDDSFHSWRMGEFSRVSIFVAGIDDVQRVPVYDCQGDDISYFVARGTLKDAYASQVRAGSSH